jgi:hypothetical protein
MLYAMEPSLDKSMLFCCGSTQKAANGTTKGVIGAIKFDQTMKLISEIIISPYEIQACTAMKRMPQNDDLIIGGFSSLLIVKFTGKKLVILNRIENIHSSKPSESYFFSQFL